MEMNAKEHIIDDIVFNQGIVRLQQQPGINTIMGVAGACEMHPLYHSTICRDAQHRTAAATIYRHSTLTIKT